MLAPEVIARIKRLHIITSRRVSEFVTGHYQSAFKGRGLVFEEVREYVPGDDVRHIDWNVTARMAKPFIKVHREERELTVCICVDVSASMWTGTGSRLKLEAAAEVAAVLAFSAVFNNDKVSLVLFDSQVREFLPPRKGASHVWRVIRSVITARPGEEGKTCLEAPLEHVMKALKRRSIVFLVSDFHAGDFERALAVASRKHDVIPVVILDEAEIKPPRAGLIFMEDPESGETLWVDFSDSRFCRSLTSVTKRFLEDLKGLFHKYRLDYTLVWSQKDVIPPLVEMFRIRERRVTVA